MEASDSVECARREILKLFQGIFGKAFTPDCNDELLINEKVICSGKALVISLIGYLSYPRFYEKRRNEIFSSRYETVMILEKKIFGKKIHFEVVYMRSFKCKLGDPETIESEIKLHPFKESMVIIEKY